MKVGGPGVGGKRSGVTTALFGRTQLESTARDIAGGISVPQESDQRSS